MHILSEYQIQEEEFYTTDQTTNSVQYDLEVHFL